jgi:hypothetical protein
MRWTYNVYFICVYIFVFKVRDGGVLVQLLIFCMLSIVLYFKQRFRDWTQSSGKNPTQLGPIDRANPYL